MISKSNTIINQDWLHDAATIKLMETLNADAQEPLALFVGGCVRNALIDAGSTDIDIATKLLPQEVKQRCEAAGMKTIPTGIDHGTITVICNHHHYEITTLRKDVATDGRRATIAYAKEWEEDAARRDFTMNTLLADIEGNVYDPLGSGISDLEQRKVIFVGNPATRIAEDLLRILRFFRMHAYYGVGDPNSAALKACREAANKIPELSRERITQEFFKILTLANPCPILQLMFEQGVMGTLTNIERTQLESLCAHQIQYAEESLPARLYLFGEVDNILLIPKAIKNEIKAIGKILETLPLTTEQEIKIAIYKHGRPATMQALLIKGAEIKAQTLTLVKTWDIPKFPITGNDLIKKGTKPGPELGEELRALEEAWIEKGFR